MSARTAAEMRAERVELLRLVHPSEEHWIELRSWVPGRPAPRKDWARTPEEADQTAAGLTARGADVHVGMVRRLARVGDGQRQYAPLHVLWTDLDNERSVEQLKLFDPAPSWVGASGGRAGPVDKLHAGWALVEPIPAADGRRYLRRLAVALDGDLAATDAGRVLRLAGSRSRKTGRVAHLIEITDDRYTVAEVVGGLPDPGDERPAATGEGPASKVQIGRRHDELVRLLGWIRRQGYGDPEVLVAFARVFCTVAVETDERRCPLDLAHAERTARSIARLYSSGASDPDPEQRAWLSALIRDLRQERHE